MADLELDVDSALACGPIEAERWQGTYFANFYVATTIVRNVRERAGEARFPVERMVGLAIIRFCWGDRHMESGRGYALERVVSLAVASSVENVNDIKVRGAYGISLSNEGGTVVQHTYDKILPGPVARLPVTSVEREFYGDMTHVAEAWIEDGMRLLPYYVALHGHPGSFIEQVVDRQSLVAETE